MSFDLPSLTGQEWPTKETLSPVSLPTSTPSFLLITTTNCDGPSRLLSEVRKPTSIVSFRARLGLKLGRSSHKCGPSGPVTGRPSDPRSFKNGYRTKLSLRSKTLPASLRSCTGQVNLPYLRRSHWSTRPVNRSPTTWEDVSPGVHGRLRVSTSISSRM